jgi:hypothetical protein
VYDEVTEPLAEQNPAFTALTTDWRTAAQQRKPNARWTWLCLPECREHGAVSQRLPLGDSFSFLYTQTTMAKASSDYLEEFFAPIRECLKYKPKFGGKSKSGKSLDEFMALYGSDAFYHWVGLDSPLMYAAHKAAGSMTSVYRQVGRGGERLIRRLLRDQLGLTAEQSAWSYEYSTGRGKTRKLSLDGRIEIADVGARAARDRVAKWVEAAGVALRLSRHARKTIRGAVFEVRQGYKSADAKRQNADLANASHANAERYLPVILLLSDQISETVAERYVSAGILLLRGRMRGDWTESCYAFSKDVLSFDLAEFFVKHSATIRREMEEVLRQLLSAT